MPDASVAVDPVVFPPLKPLQIFDSLFIIRDIGPVCWVAAASEALAIAAAALPEPPPT